MIPHPPAIVELNNTITQIFGIKIEKNQMYKKGSLNARDTAHIKQYLPDSRNSRISKGDQPVMADEIDLSNVESKHHPYIRNMLRYQEVMWNGSPSNLKVAKHAIDLKEHSKTALIGSPPTSASLSTQSIQT